MLFHLLAQKLHFPVATVQRSKCTNNKILKLDFNLFSRYFAGGSDDGSVYLYDLRKPCTGYVSRLMGGSSKHTSLNGYNRSPITDVAFHSVKSNILVVSTLEGEILRFE